MKRSQLKAMRKPELQLLWDSEIKTERPDTKDALIAGLVEHYTAAKGFEALIGAEDKMAEVKEAPAEKSPTDMVKCVVMVDSLKKDFPQAFISYRGTMGDSIMAERCHAETMAQEKKVKVVG